MTFKGKMEKLKKRKKQTIGSRVKLLKDSEIQDEDLYVYKTIRLKKGSITKVRSLI